MMYREPKAKAHEWMILLAISSVFLYIFVLGLIQFAHQLANVGHHLKGCLWS